MTEEFCGGPLPIGHIRQSRQFPAGGAQSDSFGKIDRFGIDSSTAVWALSFRSLLIKYNKTRRYSNPKSKGLNDEPQQDFTTSTKYPAEIE